MTSVDAPSGTDPIDSGPIGSEHYRIEHDTMGEVRVPRDALWAAQTQRAVENFPISGAGLESAQIIALARIKRGAAIVNGELGVLPQDVVDAIVGAADEIIAGDTPKTRPAR